jgi:hypothetical protein
MNCLHPGPFPLLIITQPPPIARSVVGLFFYQEVNMKRSCIKSSVALLGAAISMVTLTALGGIHGKALTPTGKAAQAQTKAVKASAMSANPAGQSDHPFQTKGKGTANPTSMARPMGCGQHNGGSGRCLSPMV